MYWSYGIAIKQVGLTGAQALNYESVVKMHLSWIDETDVGKLLFRAIARQVLYAPPQRLAQFNLPVQPGIPTRGVLIRPYTGNACRAGANDAVVDYSPYIFWGPCWDLLRQLTKNRGLYPQEVLFHELVHALRHVSGFGNAMGPLSGGLKGYGNTEEFLAVVVTNIFMTDPTNKRADKLGLRRDHDDFGKLDSTLADSLEFFKSSRDTFARIEQFCKDNEWFTKKLAETKATFNPIAAYYHDKDQARKNSNSIVATGRDLLQDFLDWYKPDPLDLPLPR